MWGIEETNEQRETEKGERGEEEQLKMNTNILR
jgi:hypothetical protein